MWLKPNTEKANAEEGRMGGNLVFSPTGNGNLWRVLFTHPLVGAIGAVRIAVADPTLGNAGAVGAGVLRHVVAGHHRTLLFIGSVAAVIVVIALPTLLDATSVAAGELVGATGLVWEFIKDT